MAVRFQVSPNLLSRDAPLVCIPMTISVWYHSVFQFLSRGVVWRLRSYQCTSRISYQCTSRISILQIESNCNCYRQRWLLWGQWCILLLELQSCFIEVTYKLQSGKGKLFQQRALMFEVPTVPTIIQNDVNSSEISILILQHLSHVVFLDEDNIIAVFLLVRPSNRSRHSICR